MGSASFLNWKYDWTDYLLRIGSQSILLRDNSKETFAYNCNAIESLNDFWGKAETHSYHVNFWYSGQF